MACLKYSVTHPRGWSNNPCMGDQRVVVVRYDLCCSPPTAYAPSFFSEEGLSYQSSPSTGAIESLINEVFVTPHAEIFVIGRKKILLKY